MFQKSFPSRESSSPPDAQALSNPAIIPATASSSDLASKGPKERWNQANLDYFDPHLDTKAHGVGEVVLVGKNVYYRNVVLFVQRIQNLVTFKGAALVKANTPTSLRGSVFEWYTSKLTEFDRNALNNDPGMKSWVNTLSQRFTVPTSVALGLLTNKTYSLDDAQRCRPPAQYVQAIMRHGIGCNINNVSNQLSFAYQGLAPELRVFVSPPTKSTKASNLIRILEEKQEVWFEMMTAGTSSQRPYNRLRTTYSPSRFGSRPPLVSQPDAFTRY